MAFRLVVAAICLSVFASAFPAGGPDGGIPDVIKNLSEAQKTAIANIVKNPSLSRKQIKEQIAAWAKGEGGEIEKAHTAFAAKMDGMKDKVDEKLSKLSPEAQGIAEKLKDVFLNEDLTLTQTCEQIKSIATANNASPDVQKELHIPADCNTAFQQGLDRFLNCNKNGGNNANAQGQQQ
ncbi:hypothetical protein M3Y97_00775000 [Aphelenchoides bicaudatus]|nr:hypothetical protein M3Y97_00775000 [Aphelenchoides bicaudatus]